MNRGGAEIADEIDRWVLEAQQGSEAAVELLVRQTYDDVYRFVRWKVRDAELAWDLSQMVYEKALKRLHLVDNQKGTFRVWLLKIAHHICIDYARSKAARQERQAVELKESVESERDVLADVLMKEDIRLIYHAMQQLPHEQTEALLLRYKQELTFSEMAQITGIGEAALKGRVRRALLKLKQLLESSFKSKEEMK